MAIRLGKDKIGFPYSTIMIGTVLAYKKENLIEFNECPFPTEWTKTDTGYSASNEYGEWKISATSTGGGNASNAVDGSTSTYWQSAELSASTEQSIWTLECPILIKPKTMVVESGSNSSASYVAGYNGSSNVQLGELVASSSNSLINSEETVLNIEDEQFYSKFRIYVRRYNSSNNEPRIYEFQVTSGYIKK